MNHATTAAKRQRAAQGSRGNSQNVETAPVINLFNEAAEIGTAVAPAADEKKQRTILMKEETYPGISLAIKNVINLRSAKKLIENKLKNNESKVQIAARAAFIAGFLEDGNTETFIAKAERGTAELMVIPQNAYANVNEARANELTTEYGPGIITKTTNFSFNPDLLRQYAEKINAAILATDIPHADKLALIQKTTSYSITDGTLTDLAKFGDKAHDAFYDIKPVFQLKA